MYIFSFAHISDTFDIMGMFHSLHVLLILKLYKMGKCIVSIKWTNHINLRIRLVYRDIEGVYCEYFGQTHRAMTTWYFD